MPTEIEAIVIVIISNGIEKRLMKENTNPTATTGTKITTKDVSSDLNKINSIKKIAPNTNDKDAI